DGHQITTGTGEDGGGLDIAAAEPLVLRVFAAATVAGSGFTAEATDRERLAAPQRRDDQEAGERHQGYDGDDYDQSHVSVLLQIEEESLGPREDEELPGAAEERADDGEYGASHEEH